MGTQRFRRALLHGAVSAAIGLAWPAPSRATTFTWSDNGGLGTGNWNDALNWSPSGIPGNGDTALLAGGGVILNNVSYDYTGPAVTLSLLRVSASNSGIFINVAALNMTANALTALSEYVGDTSAGGTKGRGAINQSGGSNTVNGLLILGNAASDFGTYNITSGGLTTNGIDVGYSGSGAFNESSGSVTSNSYLSVGHGITGTYNLTSGSLNVSGGLGSEYVGDIGTGTFNQSAGSNSASAAVHVGWFGNGDYELSGGLLSTPYVDVGAFSGSNGTFNHSAGTLNLAAVSPSTPFLVIGSNAGATGTYTLSGDGSIVLTGNGSELIGNGGAGTFTQTGGTNTLASSSITATSYALLSVGQAAGGAGNYNLSAGALDLENGQEVIGASGTGIFTQTGGSNSINNTFNVPDSFIIGQNAGGVGTYNMSGGTFASAAFLIGSNGGSGTMNHSGGSVFVQFLPLKVLNGTYNLSGNGALTAFGAVEVISAALGQSAAFDQSGGSNTMTNTATNSTPLLLCIASASGSTGTYDLSGGSLTLTNAQEIIGLAGNGVFNQSAGMHTLTSVIGAGAALTIGDNSGSTGVYNLSGGSVTCTNLFIGYVGGTGTMNQSGGVITLNGAAVMGFDNGSYTLSGNGVLTSVEGQEFVGAGSGNAFGFTQSGGTNTLAGTVFASLSIASGVGSSGLYKLNGGNLTAKDIFVGGDSSGAGGTGTLTLNTVNTLTASNAVTIDPLGTLNGTGSTTALVNLNGGAIAPGNPGSYFSANGTLTLGSLAINTGSHFYLKQDFFTSPSQPVDLIRVTNANGLTLAGSASIILSGPYTSPVPLISYSGTLSGTVGNLPIYGGSAELAYTTVNDTVNHDITFSTKIRAHHTQIQLPLQAAPGAGGGSFGSSLITYNALNTAGQVAFYSNLFSTSDGSTSGIFVGDGTTATAVARQMQNAPGVGGGTFNAFDYVDSGPSINAAGQVAFQATLANTIDGTTGGIFRYDPNSGLTTLVRDSDPIPGFAGQTLGAVVLGSGTTIPALSPINPFGLVAFEAGINNATDGALTGIFVAGGASLVTIARHMEAAPGAGGGTFDSTFSPETGVLTIPSINSSGQVAFIAKLNNTTDGSAAGVFRGDGTSLVAIARDKQPLPGAGGGTFGPFFTPAFFDPPIPLDDAGQVAFVNTDLVGTTDGATQGIYRGDGTTLVVIARDKRAAPGPGGGTFGGTVSDMFSAPVMNNSGQVGFAGYVTGASNGGNMGWFRSDGSSLIAIARAMQTAPGTGGGVFANAPGGGSILGHVAIAPGGQVAFVASLTGTADSSINAGLFLGDGQEIVCAALSGQVAPDNVSGYFPGTLSFFGLGPNAMNQYGQVAYFAFFSSGASGDYLYTPILHWRSGASGNWDASTNWTLSLPPAYVHDVVIDPVVPLTVTGPASTTTIKSLTVGTGPANATLQLSTGGLHVTGALTLAGAPGAWTSKIDMVKSFMIVGSAPALSDQIKTAATLGTWSGTGGITSSAAQSAAATSTATALGYTSGAEFSAASGQTAFLGQSFQPTDTLVRYTLAGDANMDGSVTFADFLALQNNYNRLGDWSQGDWNYDGQVTFADFLILQNNYNKTLPAGPIVPAGVSASVPEPASCCLLVGSLVAALGRWRRRAMGYS